MTPGRQLDLLTDWSPAEPAVRFDEGAVRAASLDAMISRAVAAALRDCKEKRPEIARRMGNYLGQPVSKNMVDAYASQARDDHPIGLSRFIALIAATHDRRLLQLIAEQFGWSVIEKQHLPLIQLAQVHEKQDELRRQADRLRRMAQGGTGT